MGNPGTPSSPSSVIISVVVSLSSPPINIILPSSLLYQLMWYHLLFAKAWLVTHLPEEKVMQVVLSRYPPHNVPSSLVWAIISKGSEGSTH